MLKSDTLLAGVELGGTKCVCIIGTGPQDVRAIERLPTGNQPDQTLLRIESTFDKWRQLHGSPAALGVACFGPLDLRETSRSYGFITTTSKQGWRNTSITRRLGDSLGVPVGFDTDVNGAALAEGRWGAAQGLRDFAYVTVGTGIGVGSIVRGRSIFGMNHTELGHIRVVRRPDGTFRGICPFHGDCIEGLASGPAIEARAGMPASKLPPDDPTWDFVVHGLAQLLHTIVLTTAPERIFLGGGVMEQSHLFSRVRRELRASLNEYVQLPQLASEAQDYVRPPGLGSMAGPLGALALAMTADTKSSMRVPSLADAVSR